ncbi:centromere-associated protein E-like [Pholidichthys leucotaenia]
MGGQFKRFASTAKKMKNDPHVTEVLDDWALLKRYRNEIMALKRRLQEVSSVTQTTETEKEVLSQLLQEKDQLQREQQDRIRNLTKLLVTSSNLIPAKKMPKRRVTWGGKMGRSSVCGDSLSDLSCIELVALKRKGPGDFVSSCEFSLRSEVSQLQLQLEIEIQQKEEATTKLESLGSRVSELEMDLQTEVQQKQEVLEKMQKTEERVAELELQLQFEIQHKIEAVEKVEMFELRTADLEQQLGEQRQTETDTKQLRQFAETIQLCETLASEKDKVTAERDYLKKELGIFIEQMKSLEKENADLSQELEEKRETDEFLSLEEEIRKQHEGKLQNEISSLKAALESSELQCLEFENKLQSLSEQLKNKSEFAEELQCMNGKDLVQEVVSLRRSLDDAENISRDTKKEWAVLRSENLSLKEMNASLTDSHDGMKAELTSLHSQLESEKSHYKKMQNDLQKELNVAFNENAKLTTLLDGKVPQNLIDSVDLERKVAILNKELTASHEAEEALRDQLASFQTHPKQVDSLINQVSELTEELRTVQTQRDNLLSVQAQYAEEAQQLRASLHTSQDEMLNREEELSQQCADVTQQLHRCDAERTQLMASMEEKTLKLEASEQHRAELESKLSDMQQLMKDLKEKLDNSEASRTTEEEISRELQEQLSQLKEELESLQAEQSAGVQRSAEDMEKLLSTLTSVTKERDEIKTNLQEQVTTLFY